MALSSGKCCVTQSGNKLPIVFIYITEKEHCVKQSIAMKFGFHVYADNKGNRVIHIVIQISIIRLLRFFHCL